MVSKEEITEALKNVVDPEIRLNIVELNMIKGLEVKDGIVKVIIALTVPGCPLQKTIKEDVERVLAAVPGVKGVKVEITSMSRQELEELRASLQKRVAERGGKAAAQRPSPISRLERKGVRNVIAVISGKGGVGKSFVTGYLAVELRRLGYEVGILDADITGPSIAKMFGLKGPVYLSQEHKVIPALTRTGIKVISMNLILEDERMPVIVRGPIINSAIRQMYSDVDWGDLHFLLVDLPPGCIASNSTVFANGGPVEVSQLKPGDYVYSVRAQVSRSGRGNKLSAALELKRVLEVIPQGESEVFELRTKSRAIKATYNHPILALSRRRPPDSRFWDYSLAWKKLADLKRGDIIVVVKRLPDPKTSCKLPRVSLKGVSPVKIPRACDEDLARLIGYFLGDGFIRINRRTRTYQVMFAEPKGGRYRAYYAKLLRKVFGKVPIYEGAREFRLISRPIVEFFSLLGLHKHALDKRVPRWIFELPASQKLALIEGYCDADGHRRPLKPLVLRGGWMSFQSPNKLLIQDLRNLCIMAGMRVTNLYSRTRTVEAPSGRKYTSKLWAFEASRSSRSCRYGAGIIRGRMGLGLVNEYIGFEKVTKVTSLGRQQVYDIKVEGDGNFIAEGIVVHNTSDAPLTVFQSLPLDGVIVVSTPQELAHMIVSKAINMARILSKELDWPVEVLGLIENMGYFKCPGCSERHEIFGPPKGFVACKQAGIPYLGILPVDPKVAELSDEGRIEEYESPEFAEVTRAVLKAAAKLLGPVADIIAWQKVG